MAEDVLKLGSLFDGIGGFPLAAQMVDIKTVWASEIEPFPVRVTQHHFPWVKHLGDITKINGADIELVDIISFGSPCQDVSIAGGQAGMGVHCVACMTRIDLDKDDWVHFTNEDMFCPFCGEPESLLVTRSGLFKEAVRIIREMRDVTNGEFPRFAIWENVPGAFSSNNGRDFRMVLESLCGFEVSMPDKGWKSAGMVLWETGSLAWRVLDAQHWGVPQRRRRIFLVVDFTGFCAPEILFKSESLSGNIEPSREAREEVAASLGGSFERAVTLRMREGCSGGGKGPLISEDKSLTLATANDQTVFAPNRVAQCVTTGPGRRYDAETETLIIEPRSQDGTPRVYRDIVPTLNTAQGGQRQPCVASIDCRNLYENEELSGTLQSKSHGYSVNFQNPVRIGYSVRRLLPIECERLQGFPDGWTDIPGASDTARYKALGNSVALPCVLHIMKQIKMINLKGGSLCLN